MKKIATETGITTDALSSDTNTEGMGCGQSINSTQNNEKPATDDDNESDNIIEEDSNKDIGVTMDALSADTNAEGILCGQNINSTQNNGKPVTDDNDGSNSTRETNDSCSVAGKHNL